MVTPEEGKERFRKFLKIFEDLSKTAKDQADFAQVLSEAIGNRDEGLVAAVADLTEEINGLRKDLRIAARAEGLGQIFPALKHR